MGHSCGWQGQGPSTSWPLPESPFGSQVQGGAGEPGGPVSCCAGPSEDPLGEGVTSNLVDVNLPCSFCIKFIR